MSLADSQEEEPPQALALSVPSYCSCQYPFSSFWHLPLDSSKEGHLVFSLKREDLARLELSQQLHQSFEAHSTTALVEEESQSFLLAFLNWVLYYSPQAMAQLEEAR